MPRLSQLRSTKRRDMRKKKILRFWIALVFAMASVGTAVFLFFNSHLFRISTIIVQGGTANLDAQVQSIAENSVSGDFLWFIPRDSWFFFPSKKLAQSIAAEFPLIENISINRQSLTSVSVNIKERAPNVVVCLGSSENNCYYADENGFIFEAASSTAGAFLTYYITLPDDAKPIGIDFLDSGRLQSLAAFVGGLAKLGFIDDSITISTSTNYDLALEEVPSSESLVPSQEKNDSELGTRDSGLVAASSTSILHLFINESRPFSETLEDFAAFWQEYAASSTNSAPPDLSSVDMRYGDNIIYKTR